MIGEMKRWDVDEWQGKREDQVDYSIKGVLICIIGVMTLSVVYSILLILK